MKKEEMKIEKGQKIYLKIDDRKRGVGGIFERFDTDLDMLWGEYDVLILKQPKRKMSIPLSRISNFEIWK